MRVSLALVWPPSPNAPSPIVSLALVASLTQCSLTNCFPGPCGLPHPMHTSIKFLFEFLCFCMCIIYNLYRSTYLLYTCDRTFDCCVATCPVYGIAESMFLHTRSTCPMTRPGAVRVVWAWSLWRCVGTCSPDTPTPTSQLSLSGEHTPLTPSQHSQHSHSHTLTPSQHSHPHTASHCQSM